MNPEWHGRRYPSMEDLVQAAEALGAQILQADIGSEALFVAAESPVPSVIILPTGQGPLRSAWLLAHELGHLHQHEGPRGALFYGKDEAQANRWAACALIPEAAIRRHRNACVDAFMGALSRHYEDLPSESTPTRRLAGRIAQLRLSCMKMEGVG